MLNPKTILVIPDQRDQPDEVRRPGHQDDPRSRTPTPTELHALLTAILRQQAQGAPAPIIQVNKTANSITIRGSASMVAIAERVIENNDKPRAEVVIDVEILEVNRTRVKQYGLNLSNYAIGIGFSPDAPPGGGTAAGGTTGGAAGGTSGTAAGSATGLTNLNTITHGISTTDFYLARAVGRRQVPRVGLARRS